MVEEIKDIKAIITYNNRLEKTIEVIINNKYRGMSPSGASKGSSEVKSIDVENNIQRINKYLKKYIGEEGNFEKISRELKFLKDKLGSNTTTAFSFALFNMNFKIDNKKTYSFPLPLSNIIGGGMHHGRMSIQEILVVPKKAKTFADAFEINREIYLEIKKYLKKKNKFLGYNDESAIISTLNSIEALNLARKYCDKFDALLGVDFASNTYYKEKTDTYLFEGKKYKRERYIEHIEKLIKEYEIVYAEDPVQEKDFDGFKMLNTSLKNTIITGDDLTTTNPLLLKEAIKHKSIKGIIIKPNQIGTLIESLEVKEIAEKNNIIPVISHRSGEGDDNTISKIAIEYSFPLAKIGIAGIRIVKINELIRLWNSVKKKKMVNLWKTLKK